MQACFRWDWGPELLTIGPDRDITLHISTISMSPWIKTSVNESLNPNLAIDLGLSARAGQYLEAEICLATLSPGSVELKRERKQITGHGKNFISWNLEHKVELWWPNGSGKPTRYQLGIKLYNSVGPSAPPLMCNIEQRPYSTYRMEP